MAPRRVRLWHNKAMAFTDQPLFLTSLINSMSDAVIAVDEKGAVALYNGAALNILDRNTAMQGLPLGSVLQPVDEHDQAIDAGQLVRDSNTAIVREDLRLRYADGSTINIYMSLSPVHAPNQTAPVGCVIVLRDITRAKSLEEERDEFISVVSHELRTPIAIAEGNIGNAEFIAEKKQVDGPIHDALHEAHQQTLFLAAMINDLATLSRAERGVLQMDISAIDVPKLLTELAAAYQQQAGDKGLTITAETSPKPLPELHSSALYVREILQNFITNAIKYTETGGVTIGAEPVAQGIRFWVRDTGIGIGKADQAKVFDKFFRAEDYRTRSTNGTGLGLYVTAKLAHLLEAEIDLASKPDHGSTFGITVPDHQPAA